MKLHPLSILYQLIAGRGWRVINFALSMLLLGTIIFPPGATDASLQNLLVAVTCIGIVYVLYVIWEVLYYQFFLYNLDDSHIYIHSGVFYRTEREVPLNRIQNVDVNRSFLQRLLGLSEVRLETAGGGQTEVVLQCVSKQDGTRLRDRIRRIRSKTTEKSGTDAKDKTEPSESPSYKYALSSESYFLLCLLSLNSGVLSWVIFSIPIVLLFATSGASGGPPGIAIVLLVVPLVVGGIALLLGWAVAAASTFARYYGFHLLKFDDSLRFERGLIQRRTGSIPLDKIQKLIIRENVIMRCFGFASLEVETAGYAPGETSDREAVIPLARREEVMKIARRIESFPELKLVHAPDRTRHRYTFQALFAVCLLTGALFGGFVLSGLWSFPLTSVRYLWLTPLFLLPGAPIAGYLKWYHIGYQLSENYCIFREGFWNRSTMIVPCYRLQTTISSQSIFQRFWQLRTLTIDTAGSYGLGRLNASATNIDADAAVRLEQAVRTRFRQSLAKHRKRQLKRKAEEKPVESRDKEGEKDEDDDDDKSPPSSESTSPSGV